MRRASPLVFVLLFAAILFCGVRDALRIQADIRTRATTAMIAATMPWAQVRVDGRNVTLVGAAPDAAARLRAGRVAASVPGVVAVDNRIAVMTSP